MKKLLAFLVLVAVVGAGAVAGAQVSQRFSDVPEGHYAEVPIAWAVDNEITKGTSETTFSPDDTLTRAQMVTFLHRYHKAYSQCFDLAVKSWDVNEDVEDAMDDVPIHVLHGRSQRIRGVERVIEASRAVLLDYNKLQADTSCDEFSANRRLDTFIKRVDGYLDILKDL